MIQIINKIGGSMTVKILNMIKTIAVMIGSRQKNKRLLWGALTGFLYFMILALISFIVGNVDEINIYDMIKTALICVTSGCAGSFFSS